MYKGRSAACLRHLFEAASLLLQTVPYPLTACRPCDARARLQARVDCTGSEAALAACKIVATNACPGGRPVGIACMSE